MVTPALSRGATCPPISDPVEGYFVCDVCERTLGPKAMAITPFGQHGSDDNYWCRPCFHAAIDDDEGEIEDVRNAPHMQDEQEHPDSNLKCQNCEFLLGRKKRRFLDRATGEFICRACFRKNKCRESKSAAKEET
jgi:hypothetical protein